ncbi:30S ribosomal protein S9 [bacterium]|nr:30S ribosomal protein S9 [bacterium]
MKSNLKKKTKEKKKEPKKVISSKKRKQKKEEEVSKPTYIRAVGRRKTAVAEVRLFPETKEKGFLVNKREVNTYFPEFELQKIIFAPLKKTSLNLLKKAKIEVLVKGGGKRAQAEALMLGLSRVLVKLYPETRKMLKSEGYLTRDPRMKERKKFGLKKARRAPQWSKR